MLSHPRPLRIAVLSYGLPTPNQKRGGIERVAHELADGLARRGHQVAVWTYDSPPPRARYRVFPLPGKRFASSWLGRRLTMGYFGNLFNVLPGFRGFDVILAHGDSLLLPVLSKPVVRVMHGSALAEAVSARTPWRLVLQLGVYVQELLTALTQPACVAVSRNARRHNPLVRHVIPNGVDLSIFHPTEAAKPPEPSLLFVGTLGGRKRGQLLLDWFARVVRPRHPSATLMMVAPPGPTLPGVSYHTGVRDAELARLYRRAWVYASPSTYEGFGLPYLEAMASGTPVVATPNVGSREVLGKGAYGVLAGDQEFPGQLLRLLGDPALRQRLAAAGLRRARDYSLDATLDGYERLLLNVCRSGAYPPRNHEG
jgi:glycosyltransferase involved in cell wall biosynthesis